MEIAPRGIAKCLQNPFKADAKKDFSANRMFQLVHFGVWFPAAK
jgi:hypothetical protein